MEVVISSDFFKSTSERTISVRDFTRANPVGFYEIYDADDLTVVSESSGYTALRKSLLKRAHSGRWTMT